jgi:hypothetical protein
MSEFFLFTPPRFTARSVARVIGERLGRKLKYQEPDELEDLDGAVDVTARVHVQVGADYLVVCAWQTETALKSWPPRRNIPWAFKDLRESLEQYPDAELTGPTDPEAA